MQKRKGFEIKRTALQEERIARKECPSCGEPKRFWKRTTAYMCCSKECTKVYWREVKVNDWRALRLHIRRKEKFRCRMCGVSVLKNGRAKGRCVVDHIIPIALGGAEFDENNLQLLCRECNKKKTAVDMNEIAKARRVQKTFFKQHTLEEGGSQ